MEFQIFHTQVFKLRFRGQIKAFGLGLLLACAFWSLGAGLGCGYSLQNTKNPLLDQEGVHKVYVAPITNNTYKAGVESVVYNSLLRVLLAHRRVSLVKDPKEADAVLTGTIDGASYSGISGTTVSSLPPTNVVPTLGQTVPTAAFPISSIYSASLACSFKLERKKPSGPKHKILVWSNSFNRNKPFPSANQLDVPGTTSSLINESEFDRALSDLATSMMEDVHESMLAMF